MWLSQNAKPFLKNISDKIHSKALADDTDNIKLEDGGKRVGGKQAGVWIKICHFQSDIPAYISVEIQEQEEAPTPWLTLVGICASQNSV